MRFFQFTKIEKTWCFFLFHFVISNSKTKPRRSGACVFMQYALVRN